MHRPSSLNPNLSRTRSKLLTLRRNKSKVIDHDLIHYPVPCSSETPSNSFLVDPGYIKRYRDPSRHDSYDIPDHHHPYEFRTRPNVTQPLPPSATQSDARRARLSMEQSWLPSSSLHRNRPSLQPNSIPLSQQSKLGVCFPGSSSQYIGMGSFLESSPSSKEFKRTWEEAQSGLNEFEPWFHSLNLVEAFIGMGYNLHDSNLLGGPIRPSDLLLTNPNSSNYRFDPPIQGLNRSLKDIVFHGPQNLLSHSVNAQPAILITSMAYLRSIEVDEKIPIRSITQVYAGHSSGEYTACVASNSIDFSGGIKLTRLYGLLSARSLELNRLKPSTFSGHEVDEPMGEELEGRGDQSSRNQSKIINESKAQMSALLINEAYYSQNPSSSQPFFNLIQTLRQFNSSNPSHHVEIASFNSSNQIVLSGTRAGVLAACARLQELEIANRAADLPCSSPFHSSFMKPASDGMKIGLESIKFKPPQRPILIAKHVSGLHEMRAPGGVDGQGWKGGDGEMVELKYIETVSDLEELKGHLFGSIHRPVWWSSTIHQLLNPHHHNQNQNHHLLDHLIFVGPGKALKNLAIKQLTFDHKFILTPHPSPLSLATMQDFNQFSFHD